jgi:hypothetical protein
MKPIGVRRGQMDLTLSRRGQYQYQKIGIELVDISLARQKAEAPAAEFNAVEPVLPWHGWLNRGGIRSGTAKRLR